MADYILQENGDKLLQETGDGLLLEVQAHIKSFPQRVQNQYELFIPSYV